MNVIKKSIQQLTRDTLVHSRMATSRYQDMLCCVFLIIDSDLSGTSELGITSNQCYLILKLIIKETTHCNKVTQTELKVM